MDKHTFQESVGVSCPDCGHVAFITRDGIKCRMKCDCCLMTIYIPTNNVLEAKGVVEGMKK